METRLKGQLDGVARSLEASGVDIPLPLKLRTAEMILRIMYRKRRRFGMFVILGWKNKWRDYLDISDSEQDIFASHRVDLMRGRNGAPQVRDVASTVDFDGAILIDRRGVIIHSGVIIEGLRPRVVARKVNPGNFKDLSEQFGFDTKVHARHLSAITASYVFKGTTVFTVSEETDAFHVFERGTIVHHC